MKKIVILVAFLFVCSIASAAIMLADPKNTDGSLYVTVPVYNNSGGALDVGDVVVWDIGSSTGDNDLYITTTTTSNTGLVAGVVNGSIAEASPGSIIVYGFAECDIASSPVGPVINGTLLCTSGTDGGGEPCTDISQAYAIANATIVAGAQGNCFVIKHN